MRRRLHDWAVHDRDLIDRVAATAGLTPAEAARVIEDVLAWYREPVEDYVRRRHAHHQLYGRRNPEIFALIADELAGRLVAAPSLTERQLRRIVYGCTDEELPRMCGIVGYIGNQNAAPILIEGLSRLEYRGYDSAGVAVLGARGTQVYRKVGRVRDLEASLPRRLAGKVGIGHTRWATHGPATEANAHPQTSEDRRISVVHNGIIDNAAALRERLDARGVKLHLRDRHRGIAHLIARSPAGTLEDAVLEALSRITGTYAILVSTSATRTGWSRPGTAPRSSWASATARCSSPATCPPSSGTPARWCTWTTASWPR